jgi:DNA-binding PadR family transcriptional regulator
LNKKKLLKSVLKLAGEKERKIYELTEKGERLCVQLFKRFASLVSVAIEPSLEICAHCGCKVYEGEYLEEIEGDKLTFLRRLLRKIIQEGKRRISQVTYVSNEKREVIFQSRDLKKRLLQNLFPLQLFRV